MIALNLLPDIKKEYHKTQRNRRIVMFLSFALSAGFVALVVLGLIYTKAIRGPHADNLETDISNAVADIRANEDLDKILTVNSQLEELPLLHDQKPVSSRLLQYLNVLTPDAVSINELNVQFSDPSLGDDSLSRLTFSGRAEEVADINILADTLKNATYTIDQDSQEVNAFSQVAVESIGSVANDSSDRGISYSVRTQYDPQIFAVTNPDIKLTVPNITSSRANQETPSVLFDAQPEEDQ